MTEIERLETKVAHVRRLAKDSGATEAERDNARQRAEELDAKIAEQKEQERNDQSWRKPVNWPSNDGSRDGVDVRAGIARMKKRVKEAGKAATVDDRPIKEDWPFGWVKTPVRLTEVEQFENDANNTAGVSWKCPHCGNHVTTVISHKHLLRLQGQRGGLDGFVELIVDGTKNQLCNNCWEYWDNQ